MYQDADTFDCWIYTTQEPDQQNAQVLSTRQESQVLSCASEYGPAALCCRILVGLKTSLFGSFSRHLNCSWRYYCWDRWLVDHLTYCALQKNDKLVERFNLSLQFNPANQIDWYRDALFPQRIKKRVLQRLPFLHGLSWDSYTSAAAGMKESLNK